jgi:hypothetical protein
VTKGYTQKEGEDFFEKYKTRPNISFAVSKLSRFTSNLRDDHWCALDWVMHYFIGTMD